MRRTQAQREAQYAADAAASAKELARGVTTPAPFSRRVAPSPSRTASRPGIRQPPRPSIKGRDLEAAGQMPLFGTAAEPTRVERPQEPPQPPRIGPMSPSSAKGVATRRANEIAEIELAKIDARNGDDTGLLPYQPTPSINPPRPRTLAAGYSPASRTMFVRFRDGTPWEYYNVTPAEWRNFTRVQSPGRAINRIFNFKSYQRGSW